MNRILIEDHEEIRELMNSTLLEYDKVIVLGCSGMLGFYISSILTLHFNAFPIRGDIPVVGVSRKITSRIQELQFEFPEIFKSIDYNHLDREFSDSRKTLVIHAASPSSVQSINTDPLGAIETNIELTLEVLNLIKDDGGHIVFLSSGEVYGDLAPTPTNENDYAPINHLIKRGMYPEMKKAAEVILQTYCESNNKISATSLRVFHTFGPGLNLDDPRIFGVVCNSIYYKKEVRLNSDGSTVRVFLYSRDLVSAILHSIQLKGFNVFNVAGQDPLSISDFCKMSLALGVPKVLFSEDTDNTPRNTQIGFADTNRLENLGWYPSVSTFDALHRTALSFENLLTFHSPKENV